MLIKRRDGQAAKQRLASLYGDFSPSGGGGGGLDRRGFLRQAGLGGAGLAALGTGLGPGRAQAAGEKMGILDHGRPVQRIKNVCTHCSVGCTVIAEVQDEVWVGQEPAWESPINQGTHCAKGASVRELVQGERRLKYPAEAGGRRVAPPVLGPGAGRDLGQAPGDPRAQHAGGGVLARQRQVHQRGVLSVPQVRRLLGHQHRRPPGAHLPLHHGRRRSQHLGLRRDDQLLQRPPQQPHHDHHGRQPGRGASDRHAARAGGAGREPRQPVRHRPALHPHRGARDRAHAHPPRHRHPGGLGHALAHLPERLGRQGIHPAARLRHGRGPRRGRQVEPAGGGARHRPARARR